MAATFCLCDTMVTEIKTLKDRCVDALQYTTGELLQISANLQSTQQFAVVLEAHAHSVLGSKYVPQRAETMLRLSDSYKGKMRDDIVKIGSGSNKDPQQSTGGPQAWE